ncbi:MAG: hypothetical protein K2X93_18330 [Candidatus Obscuribacterales bacterium]|nr:hypothetical protein [Candidatus Obscuribacterales bacterium]
MRTSHIFLVLALTLLSSMHAFGTELRDAVSLNDEGVRALKKQDWKIAFNKFEEALVADPHYQKAQSNLAIAHNNYALHLAAEKPDESLKQFHLAVYLDPNNETTIANMHGLMRRVLRKSPDDFADRVKLGDKAKESSDLIGAVVEYKAALKLRKDSKVEQKLEEVSQLMKEKQNGNSFSSKAKMMK